MLPSLAALLLCFEFGGFLVYRQLDVFVYTKLGDSTGGGLGCSFVRGELRAAGWSLERCGVGAEEVALGREKGPAFSHLRCGSHANRHLIGP